MSKIVMINIERIVHDTALQCRVAMDEDHIADMMQHINDTPPIRLYPEETPEGPLYYIGDGWHRKIAHERLGLPILRATLHEGGREGALLFAVRANTAKEHGIKRTRADKQKAIVVYLTHKDWYLHSDPMVAKACDVDKDTVVSARAALELAGTIPKATMRLGADGKVRAATQQKQPAVPHVEELPLDIPPKDLTPKASAVKPCAREDCPSTAWGSSLYCEADSLRISDSTTRDARSGPSLYDAAEAKYKPSHSSSSQEAKQEDPSLPSLQSPSVGGSQDAPSQASELESVVDDVIARNEPRDPKTLLPLSQSNGAKPNGERFQGYNTPDSIILPARKIDVIALDPCHNNGSRWEARKTINEKQNSLLDTWDWTKLASGGLIPVNPPYNNISPFVDKICLEAAKGAQLLLIVPNRSETAWHQKASRSCKLRVEIAERVKFLKNGEPDGSPYEPTIIFYWGPKPGYFAAAFESMGFLSASVDPVEYAVSAEMLRAKALAERQAELPILAGEHPTPALPKDESEEKASREITPEPDKKTCLNCGEVGTAPLAFDICDECALDGLQCAVCFEAIEQLGRARLITPAGMTTNAVWQCGKHEPDETPIDDSREVFNPLIGETQTKPASSTCDNCRLPKPIAGSAQGLSVCADCLATLTPKEEKKGQPLKVALPALASELEAQGYSVTVSYPKYLRTPGEAYRWMVEETLEHHLNHQGQVVVTYGAVPLTKPHQWIDVHDANRVLVCRVFADKDDLTPKLLEMLRATSREQAEDLYEKIRDDKYKPESVESARCSAAWRDIVGRVKYADPKNAPQGTPKKNIAAHTPPRPQLVNVQLCVQSSLSPKGRKELTHILGKSRPIDGSLRQYLLTLKELDQVQAAEDKACLFVEVVNEGEWKFCTKCGLVVDDVDRRNALKSAPVPFVEHEGAIYCEAHDPSLSPLDLDLKVLCAATTNEESLTIYDKLVHRYIRDSKATKRVMDARQAWLAVHKPAPAKACPDCNKKFSGDEFEKHRLTHLKTKPKKQLSTEKTRSMGVPLKKPQKAGRR